jgi:hypothetical protein
VVCTRLQTTQIADEAVLLCFHQPPSPSAQPG